MLSSKASLSIASIALLVLGSMAVLSHGAGLAAKVTLPTPTRAVMGFTSHTVIPAVGVAQDLYEPTITTSSSGAMYVAGHVIGADSTGTPTYLSTNKGVTWTKLPVIGPVIPAYPIPGAAPPGGDEGIVVADGSHAWLVDTQDSISMSVQGWCTDGASQCFYQPDAYNNQDALVCAGSGGIGIGAVGTDRPWAAEALIGSSNKLLIVNNGALGGTMGNVAQIGILDVTPGLPVGAVQPTWNPCTGNGYVAGYIPGPPALSTGGRFVVPQIQGSSPQVAVITGTVAGGVGIVTTTNAFGVVNRLLSCSSNYGFSTVSNSGTFYIAAADTSDNKRIKVAATTSGTTFKTGTMTTTDPVAFMWITGSQTGEGALLSWAEDKSGGACTNVDFHTVHVTLSGTGFPLFADATTVVTGQAPCGDLMGSSVGPDGNAAIVVFSHPNRCLDTPLPAGTPLTVYVQTSGPTI